MKKISAAALLIAATVFIPSCSCDNGEGDKEQDAKQLDSAALATKAAMDGEAVKVEFDSLLASVSRMKMAPFVTATKDGRIVLTQKEKMVKPDYLLDPALAEKTVTLAQKYHLTAMMAVDVVLANMYEMSVTDAKEALAKLLVDINDEAFTSFANTPWSDLEGASDALSFMMEQEYEASRQDKFWDAIAASLTEQLFIMTKNTDKFMPMFDDKSVSDFTFNLICLEEGIRSLAEDYPEMASLKETMAPLYCLNATSVAEFRTQLAESSQAIQAAREALIK